MEEITNRIHRDSFIFYRSFYEAIEQASDTDQLQIYRGIAQFALNGTEPEFTGLLQAVWLATKPILEANNRRYGNGCKGGVYGKRGGAPKGNLNARKQPQNNPKTTPNVYVDEYEDEYERESTHAHKKKSLSVSGGSPKRHIMLFICRPG